MIARARCGPFYWNFMTTDFMSWHANKPLFAYRVKEVHLVETKIYVDTRKQYLLICGDARVSNLCNPSAYGENPQRK